MKLTKLLPLSLTAILAASNAYGNEPIKFKDDSGLNGVCASYDLNDDTKIDYQVCVSKRKGKISEIRQYFHDGKHDIPSREVYDIDGNGIADQYIDREFDVKGRVTKSTLYSRDGQRNSETFYKYDPHGNRCKAVTLSPFGREEKNIKSCE